MNAASGGERVCTYASCWTAASVAEAADCFLCVVARVLAATLESSQEVKLAARQSNVAAVLLCTSESGAPSIHGTHLALSLAQQLSSSAKVSCVVTV